MFCIFYTVLAFMKCLMPMRLLSWIFHQFSACVLPICDLLRNNEVLRTRAGLPDRPKNMRPWWQQHQVPYVSNQGIFTCLFLIGIPYNGSSLVKKALPLCPCCSRKNIAVNPFIFPPPSCLCMGLWFLFSLIYLPCLLTLYYLTCVKVEWQDMVLVKGHSSSGVLAKMFEVWYTVEY